MQIGFLSIIRNRIKCVFRNRFRFILTISGIFLAGFFLMLGYFMIDSYYYSSFKKYSYFDENNIVEVNYADKNNYIENTLVEKHHSKLLFFIKQYNVGLENLYEVNDKDITIGLNIYNTNSNFNGSLLKTDFEVKPSKLLKGEGITQININEASNVMVIGSILESFMFDGDGIGRTIKVPIYNEIYNSATDSWLIDIDYYEEFLVVGVYESLNEEYVELNKSLDAKQIENIIYSSNCYIPSTIIMRNSVENEADYVFYNVENSLLLEKDILTDSELNNDRIYRNNLFSYNSLVVELEEQLSVLKNLLSIIVFILCIFSILVGSTIMLFSIKDRVSEIGIKKAIGAKNKNIFIEIIEESAIFGIIAFIISFLFSYMICLILLNVMQSSNSIESYYLIIRPETVIVSFLILELTSILSGFAPAVYATKIEIVEAVKFE